MNNLFMMLPNHVLRMKNVLGSGQPAPKKKLTSISRTGQDQADAFSSKTAPKQRRLPKLIHLQ
jgi:hypothetical protein